MQGLYLLVNSNCNSSVAIHNLSKIHFVRIVIRLSNVEPSRMCLQMKFIFNLVACSEYFPQVKKRYNKEVTQKLSIKKGEKVE